MELFIKVMWLIPLIMLSAVGLNAQTSPASPTEPPRSVSPLTNQERLDLFDMDAHADDLSEKVLAVQAKIDQTALGREKIELLRQMDELRKQYANYMTKIADTHNAKGCQLSREKAFVNCPEAKADAKPAVPRPDSKSENPKP